MLFEIGDGGEQIKYIVRLDDACEYMDVKKWRYVEELLDSHHIKPLVSVIPNCMDRLFTHKYVKNEDFWSLAVSWQDKGWDIALHGYNHVYTNFHAKGLNPINPFSEFVGLPLKEQGKKIRDGMLILKEKGLDPNYFVAPGHSFDENTLLALKNESDIRIISDSVASKVYYENDFWFIPQQCGELRALPCQVISGCYHPNTMNQESFERLERFIIRHKSSMCSASTLDYPRNEKDFYDRMLSEVYYGIRRIRKGIAF